MWMDGHACEKDEQMLIPVNVYFYSYTGTGPMKAKGGLTCCWCGKKACWSSSSKSTWGCCRSKSRPCPQTAEILLRSSEHPMTADSISRIDDIRCFLLFNFDAVVNINFEPQTFFCGKRKYEKKIMKKTSGISCMKNCVSKQIVDKYVKKVTNEHAKDGT